MVIRLLRFQRHGLPQAGQGSIEYSFLPLAPDSIPEGNNDLGTLFRRTGTELALPYGFNIPASLLQQICLTTVPFAICIDLRAPEVGSRLGQSEQVA